MPDDADNEEESLTCYGCGFNRSDVSRLTVQYANKDTLATICYVGNALLAAIAKAKES